MTTKHELLRYAALIWEPGDLVEIRPLPISLGKRVWIPAGNLAMHLTQLQAENQRGANIYAGVLPRTIAGGGKAEHTDGGRILWIDCDRIEAEIALNLVKQSGVPPPIMAVSSGHGAHIYWKLAQKLPKDDHSRLLKALYYYLALIPALADHVDSTTQESARILRLPGFINHKSPIADCRIVYTEPRAINAQDAWQKVLADASPPRMQGRAANGESDQPETKNNPPTRPQSLFTPGLVDDRDRKYALSALRNEADLVASKTKGNRNKALNNAALALGHYVGGGLLSDFEASEALLQAARQCGLPEDEAISTIRSGITAGMRDPKRAPPRHPTIYPGFDISGILKQAPRNAVTNKHGIVTVDADEATDISPSDPGTLPDSFYRIPGFISDVMDFTLEVTPAPNEILAFCGALVLQAHLAGRKVRDPGNIRTNIYILALANPGAGKDWPRKINNQIMHEIEAGRQIANRWSSGEGIQDALIKDKAVLFQADEIAGIFTQINKAKDARFESARDELLTVYTSSDGIYKLRLKANSHKENYQTTEISQPCVTILGSAPPEKLYKSLSMEMITDGLFARMFVIEAERPVICKDAGLFDDIPDKILTAARWWIKYLPKGKNGEDAKFAAINPRPTVIPYTTDAQTLIDAWKKETQDLRNAAANDLVKATFWSRGIENARKFALIYAISANRLDPQVTSEAVEWAITFTRHHIQRMLYMTSLHVAVNEVHANKQAILRLLEKSPHKQLTKSQITNKTPGMRSKERDDLLLDLEAAGNIKIIPMQTGGREKMIVTLLK